MNNVPSVFFFLPSTRLPLSPFDDVRPHSGDGTTANVPKLSPQPSTEKERISGLIHWRLTTDRGIPSGNHA